MVSTVINQRILIAISYYEFNLAVSLPIQYMSILIVKRVYRYSNLRNYIKTAKKFEFARESLKERREKGMEKSAKREGTAETSRSITINR